MTPSDEMLKKGAYIKELYGAKDFLRVVKANSYNKINGNFISKRNDFFWIATYKPSERSAEVKSWGCNDYYNMFVEDYDEEGVLIRYNGKTFTFYPNNVGEIILACKFMSKFYDDLF